MINHSSHAHRQHTAILKNHEFLQEVLKGERLFRFKEMISKFGLVLDYNGKHSSEAISMAVRLKDVMGIINDGNLGTSLTKTFKKLAVLHIFIRKAAISEFDGELEQVCFQMLEQIKSHDFKALTKGKSWGMQQFCKFFKELGKENCSPQSIQQQSSRTVMKEIVQHIYHPFYLYLLKILQDRQIYSSILKGKENASEMLLWKMVNLCKQLGGIINQLNRICRYFRNELLGIYCHFAYIISLDINVFYNTLRNSISNQCSQWREVIDDLQTKKSNDYAMYQEGKLTLIQDSNFIELKRYIQQLLTIREDLIWIYLNRQLKCCLKHFCRPLNGIQIEINPNHNHITYFQAFMESSNSPRKLKKERRTSIEVYNEQFEEKLEKGWELVSTGISIGEGQQLDDKESPSS